MNDGMNLDSAPQDTPPIPSVWRQIKWKVVPENKLTLTDRMHSINSIVSRLNEVSEKLLALKSADNTYNQKLFSTVTKLSNLTSQGIAVRDHLSIGLSTDFPDENTLKQLADSFLTPYHQSEAGLRTQVENLARESNNREAVEDLIATIAKLQIE
jgi:hypothetical protein